MLGGALFGCFREVRTWIAALTFGVGLLACETEKAATDDDESTGCLTGDVCAADTDCESGTRCNNDVCIRLYCLEDGSACDTNDVCQSRECAFGTVGSVCWSGPRPAGWVCLGPGDCESGLLCVGAICTAPNSVREGETCYGEGECAAGLFCYRGSFCTSTASGICSRPLGSSEICCDASQCASSYACRNTTCSGNVARRCGPLAGLNGSCCENSDCQTGLVCEATSAAAVVGECHNAPAPLLRAMPESITFNFVQGGLNPVDQAVFVGNAGTGTLDFSASSSESWFTVEPTSGAVLTSGAAVELTLSVVEGDYNVGTFTGRLTLHDSAAANSPLEVPVTLVVSAP